MRTRTGAPVFPRIESRLRAPPDPKGVKVRKPPRVSKFKRHRRHVRLRRREQHVLHSTLPRQLGQHFAQQLGLSAALAFSAAVAASRLSSNLNSGRRSLRITTRRHIRWESSRCRPCGNYVYWFPWYVARRKIPNRYTHANTYTNTQVRV